MEHKAQENLEAVKSDVKSTFHVLLSELKRREKELLQQAESVLKEQMRMIETDEQVFYNNLKDLEKICKSER